MKRVDSITMENKIVQFEFVDCSTIVSESSDEDNNSSGLDSKEQAIGRPYMLDSSDIIIKQLIPIVKTEPREPEVKTEPNEHPVVKDEPNKKPQLVVKAETIEEPVNLNQVYGNPLSNTFVGEFKALRMIRNKRHSLMIDRQGTVIRNIAGKIRREWRKPQDVNKERPIRPKCKCARDCRNLLKEQYILCKKLVLEDCTSKSSRCNSSLSSQTSISEHSSDCESDSKYRINRNRNNLSSKRSREKRKESIKQLQHELEELNEKNRKLRVKLDSLVKFLKDLNAVLLHCEQTKKG